MVSSLGKRGGRFTFGGGMKTGEIGKRKKGEKGGIFPTQDKKGSNNLLGEKENAVCYLCMGEKKGKKQNGNTMKEKNWGGGQGFCACEKEKAVHQY